MILIHNFLNKIKHSFIESTKGRESFSVVTWMWGGLFYFITIMLIEPRISSSYVGFFGRFLSSLIVLYALWHFYVSIKCAPKKLALSKEEKKLEKMKQTSFFSSISKKFFLQEPITKINPRNILVLLDLYIVIHFAGLIF